MNTLFVIYAPLGDSINFSCFLYDYYKEFLNEKIYVCNMINSLNDLFKSCSFCNIIKNDIHYDKVYEYKLDEFNKKYKTDFNEYSLQDIPYLYFDKIYNLNIKRQTKYVPLELDDYQKSSMNICDKPICLVNAVCQYFGFDARFLGVNKIQKVIDELSNKIDFISIGSFNGVTVPHKLINIKHDLINKTSIYELMHLIYNSKFVFTGESGIYHLSQLCANEKRHIIITAGKRWALDKNRYYTKNVDIHWISSSNTDHNDFYKNVCLNDGSFCTKCVLLNEINGNRFGNDNGFCLSPILYNNELISQCQADISIDEILNVFNEILKEYK